ncbi:MULTISPECIES: CinA family protein [Phenylobacterium]|uniref:Nicotinamide-nucleotide amidase n=1 Tax=Phenylobacterium koreense TaxID=266125 RepID=A0ABV2EJX5_9CAUL
MAEALSPILPPEIEAATHRLLQEACDRKLRLATAESCTGGLIASLLTDVPGCSHAFERAFVTYTNEAKEQLLGVTSGTLAAHGPVSEETVRQMAAGALAGSPADVVLAVTGWTESGPDPSQPAGLVWFGAARRGGPITVRQAHFGDVGRAAIRLACLEVALEMMARAVMRAP